MSYDGVLCAMHKTVRECEGESPPASCAADHAWRIYEAAATPACTATDYACPVDPPEPPPPEEADGSVAPFSDVAANGNIHMCVQKMGCYGGPACVAAGMAHGCYDCTSTPSADCKVVNIAPGNEG